MLDRRAGGAIGGRELDFVRPAALSHQPSAFNRSGQDPLNFPIQVNNRLANLLSMAQRGDGAPNNNLEEILGILSAELKGYTDRLAGVWSTDLAAVNRELGRLSLAPLDPGCRKAEGCRLVP